MEKIWTYGMFNPSTVPIVEGINHSWWISLIGPSNSILLFVTGGRNLSGKYKSPPVDKKNVQDKKKMIDSQPRLGTWFINHDSHHYQSS